MSMFDPRRGPFVAAKPPSDFVAAPSGSGMSQGMKIGLGLGCGAIVLVGGLLLAGGLAGGLKCAECADTVKTVLGARVGVVNMVAALQEGSIDNAQAMLGEPAASQKGKLAEVMTPYMAALKTSTCLETAGGAQSLNTPEAVPTNVKKIGGDTAPQGEGVYSRLVVLTRGPGQRDIVISARTRPREGAEPNEQGIAAHEVIWMQVGDRPYYAGQDASVVGSRLAIGQLSSPGLAEMVYPTLFTEDAKIESGEALKALLENEPLLSSPGVSFRPTGVEHSGPGKARVWGTLFSSEGKREVELSMQQKELCSPQWLLSNLRFGDEPFGQIAPMPGSTAKLPVEVPTPGDAAGEGEEAAPEKAAGDAQKSAKEGEGAPSAEESDKAEKGEAKEAAEAKPETK